MAAKLSGPSGQGGRTIEQNAEINVTPFVDIMLVLLIIFMVVAPLATVSIKLDLPPAVPSNVVDPREPVYISLQESGQIFIAQDEVALENLPSAVCAALQPTPNCRDERLFVRGQPEVKYGQFMEVMNTMQQNGFLKVGLLNEDIE